MMTCTLRSFCATDRYLSHLGLLHDLAGIQNNFAPPSNDIFKSDCASLFMLDSCVDFPLTSLKHLPSSVCFCTGLNTAACSAPAGRSCWHSWQQRGMDRVVGGKSCSMGDGPGIYNEYLLKYDGTDNLQNDSLSSAAW